MQKFLNFKNIVAIIFIGIGLSMELSRFMPDVIIPKPDVAILNIDKPNDKILSLVQPTSDLVTDPTDRAKLAIYSQEFAIRVKKYDSNLQQINDVLSLSAKEFFKDTITDKYSGLDDGIVTMITTAVNSDENNKLTDVEKNKLSDVFMGFAWALIQKK